MQGSELKKLDWRLRYKCTLSLKFEFKSPQLQYKIITRTTITDLTFYEFRSSEILDSSRMRYLSYQF